jgi:hypothetical protein
MELSSGQILYISVLTCLFLILNIVVLMKTQISSFSIIVILISIISFIVLATLSTIEKN